jgi:DNA-binding CsgD family transcriptional regulator
MKEDSRSVACYRLHETMREFARLQLTEAGGGQNSVQRSAGNGSRERTVDSHVRSIMNKLGFSSRAQIAGWIAAQRR